MAVISPIGVGISGTVDADGNITVGATLSESLSLDDTAVADGDAFVAAVGRLNPTFRTAYVWLTRDVGNGKLIVGNALQATPGSFAEGDSVEVYALPMPDVADRVFVNTGNTLDWIDGDLHLVDMALGARDFSTGTLLAPGQSLTLEIANPGANGITWAAGTFVGDFDFAALTGTAIVVIYHNGITLRHVFCGEAA